jgi:hypothetical protein
MHYDFQNDHTDSCLPRALLSASKKCYQQSEYLQGDRYGSFLVQTCNGQSAVIQGAPRPAPEPKIISMTGHSAASVVSQGSQLTLLQVNSVGEFSRDRHSLQGPEPRGGQQQVIRTPGILTIDQLQLCGP